MTVYGIAELHIHDRERYDRYAAGFMPVLRQYGGRLLAADNQAEVVEGQWDGDRVVLFSFTDRDAFTTWAASPEYQAIVGDRLDAADTTFLLVRGVE